MKNIFWLARLHGEPVNVFDDRKDAVLWLKECLFQELKDFIGQDLNDDYDYPIGIGELTIEPFVRRSSGLGL